MVRCADCGLLAIRHGIQLLEIDEESRGLLELSVIEVNKRWVDSAGPLCSALAANLRLESEGKTSQVSATLGKDRPCLKFTPWVPGFSPKEHREMIHEAELRKIADAEKESQRSWQFRMTILNIFVAALVGGFVSIMLTLVNQMMKRDNPQPIIIQMPANPEKK